MNHTGVFLLCKVVIPSIPSFQEDWIRFMVDTGSTSTRVGESDARRLGLKFDSLKRNGIGATNAQKEVSEDYTIRDALLVVRDAASDIEVRAIFDRGIVFTKGSDTNLLGWDFLSKHKLTYDGEDFIIEV